MFNSPESDFEKPHDFDRPPMMAIGDSLYNGMRSATIDKRLAAKSVPAMVARALDISFSSPLYPRPVLMNFEEELRELGGTLFMLPKLVQRFDEILDSIKDNANFWVNLKLNTGPITFDNLAVAGSEVRDLIDISHSEATRTRDAIWEIYSDRSPSDWPLRFFHMMINSSYTLNPRMNSAFGNFRPIDWVALRKPKRLLVNIGPNHGLVSLALGSTSQNGRDELKKLPDEIARLGEYIAALPGEVEHVYFNNMLVPSAFGNLMPPRINNAFPPPPGPGKYYDEYHQHLPIEGYHRFSGQEMKDFDNFVMEINELVVQKLRSKVGSTRKLHITDLNFFRSSYDGKHDRRQALSLNGKTYTNNALACTGNPFSGQGWFERGGIFSLDNMHPSTLGYALFAEKVLQTISEGENLRIQNPIDIEQIEYDLLDSVPSAWAIFPDAFREIQRGKTDISGEQVKPDEEGDLERIRKVHAFIEFMMHTFSGTSVERDRVLE